LSKRETEKGLEFLALTNVISKAQRKNIDNNNFIRLRILPASPKITIE